MPIQYKVIEIFTSEESLVRGQPLHRAVVDLVSGLKIPARVIVARGMEGLYESGELATARLEALSYNLPVRITITLPASDLEAVCSRLDPLVTDGILGVSDIEVICHRTRGRLLPRQTKVHEIMTPAPRTVQAAAPLNEVARILLSSPFTALPVVDESDRPVGVIAQGDLIYRGGMPMRIGLLSESGSETVGSVLDLLASRQARDIMTRPAVTIGQDRLVTEAVDRMLAKGVKRLPVTDAAGKLVGILSRVDVFRAAMRTCPDWAAFRDQAIHVEGIRHVFDIMRRDTHTVAPDTPIEEVLRIIECNDIQRVCVVDENGRFLGLISDRDLLIAFSERHPGIWSYFAAKIPFSERAGRIRELQAHLRARTASEVMNTQVVTVQEDATLEEAIRLMLERAIKRLPVLDEQGKFRGMISRESLLRTGFASSH